MTMGTYATVLKLAATESARQETLLFAMWVDPVHLFRIVRSSRQRSLADRTLLELAEINFVSTPRPRKYPLHSLKFSHETLVKFSFTQRAVPTLGLKTILRPGP